MVYKTRLFNVCIRQKFANLVIQLNRMKNFILALSLFCFAGQISAQKPDTLVINYYENAPFAYAEANVYKGIEADILREFTNWLQFKKNMTVVVQYKGYQDFSKFYNAIKNGGAKDVGVGTVARSAEREKEVVFSPPYMRNVSVLVTSGGVTTVRSRTATDITAALQKCGGVAVGNSSHYKYMEGIRKNYMPSLKITTAETQIKVLDEVSTNPNLFGYVDIVAYWSYMKSSNKFLKMHKAMSETNEYLSFIMPKNSLFAGLLNEFFEGGFGFTSTRAYHAILEKYLGYEVIEAVELN
jgi:putative glutamine transport system substrate-binding protein